MSAVTLTPATRANLFALLSTSELLQMTQRRLATGLRINSALDNPNNFFTARALDNRATDLNVLLDQMGQAQQAIRAAHTGLGALTKLVQSAIAIAQQARQTVQTAAGYDYLASVVGSANVTPQPITELTGAVPLGQTSSMALPFVSAACPTRLVSVGSAGPDQIVDDINSSPGLGPSGVATAFKDASGRLVLTSNSAPAITVDPLSGGALAAGLINPDLIQVVPGLNGRSLTVQANGLVAANDHLREWAWRGGDIRRSETGAGWNERRRHHLSVRRPPRDPISGGRIRLRGRKAADLGGLRFERCDTHHVPQDR